MTVYFVTRHPGAIDWAARRGIVAEPVEHLDVDVIRPGDEVLGTLPVQLAAEVCARGARYRHLTLTVPQDKRGHALSADEMDAFGAVLEEFDVRKVLR